MPNRELSEMKIKAMRDLLGRALYKELEDSEYGFCLILVNDQSTAHASNIERRDLIRLLRDHADQLGEEDELVDVPESD